MTSTRYTIYTSITAGVLCALIGLLSSCEKELAGGGTGRKVGVNILLNSSEFADDMRRSVAPAPRSETTLIPLGDDLYLSATLTEAPVDELRATVNLAEGQKVRLAAFQNTTSVQESAADYIYSGGALDPVSSPLSVEEGAYYNIVAYTYFNETTDYPVATAINSSKQLLWGTSGQQQITMANATVSITMTQRLAQVKVSIRTTNVSGTPNITAVSDVAIVSGGNRCALTVHNGTLVTGATPATQAVSFSTFGSATVTSAPRTIYPVTSGQTTTVTIGSVSIDGFASPLTNLTASFTQAFLEGHSYVLTLDLNRTGVAFAGSNIYWDGSRLTFEPAGHVGEENFYQGVFFKWGSMVGVSPYGLIVDGSTRIYYPTGDNTWSADETTLSSLYANWQAIPSMSVNLAANYGSGRNSDYVTNGYASDNGGQPFNYTDKLGDICRRINPNYRLPRSEEFGGVGNSMVYTWGSATTGLGWFKGTNISGTSFTFPTGVSSPTMDYEGTAVLDHDTYAHFGGGFATYRGVVKFPMSGYRDGPDGAIVQIGAEVQHWTSSLYNNMGKAPYKEYMGDYCLMLGNTGNPDTDGLPVRCVKD